MENEQMEQETILLPESAPYGVPAEQMAEGYRAFQKKFLRRGFWIRVGLVLFCLADFLGVAIWRFVNGRSVNSMTYVLIVLCAALLFVLWYNPKKARNSVLNAAKQLERDRYTVTFRAHDLVIRTILPPQEAPEEDAAEASAQEQELPPNSVLPYGELTVSEQQAYYLLFFKKECIYIISKSAFSAEQLQQVNSILRENVVVFQPLSE